MRKFTITLLLATSLSIGTNMTANAGPSADESLAPLPMPRLPLRESRSSARDGWTLVRSESIHVALSRVHADRSTAHQGQGDEAGGVVRGLLRGTRGPRAWVCNSWHAYVKPSMGFAKVHRRVLWLIRCATNRWTVPGGYSTAVYIASRESGPYTWPWAENPSGSSGIFQIIDSTYRSWWVAFGERCRMHRLANNVYNARTNVLLSVWAMNAYGLGAWGMS